MENDFPTRDQARGLLILRNVTIDGNSDAIAIIQAYIDGRLVLAEPDYEAIADELDGGIPIGPFEWRVNEAKRLWAAGIGYIGDMT